jgi:hypothetical protein
MVPLRGKGLEKERRNEITSQDKESDTLIKEPRVISLQWWRRVGGKGEKNRFKPANHVCIKFPFTATDKKEEGAV